MASYNKVILLGNVTRDVESRFTPGGTAVAEIGLAVNRQWFDKTTNQKKEETTFVDVTVWGRTAEVAAEYLRKGRSVLIEGRLQLDQWDDKTSGEKRSKLKVIGEEMRLVGGGRDGEQGGDAQPKAGGQSRSGGGSRSQGSRGGAGQRSSGRASGTATRRPAPARQEQHDTPGDDIPDDDVPF